MTSSLWRLDAVDTTLLLLATGDDDVPSIIWFGQRIPASVNAESVASVCDLPLPMAKLDTSVPLSLFPQRSTGIDCLPAFRAHSDGTQFDHRFVRDKVAEIEGGLLIELRDPNSMLRVSLQLTLHDESGVLTFVTTLSNDSKAIYTVDWLASATMSLPPHYRECMQLHGRWGLEFQTARTSINAGTLLFQSHRGRTSHECYPGVIIGESGFGENNGDVCAANLAWSGSHSTAIELMSDGRLYYQSGISFDPGELQLEPGKTFTAPACHFSRRAAEGMNAVSHAMHQYLRAEVLPDWTRTQRFVHANSWEALYFDHDIDTLKSLVDAAVELGAERFILDDGWFPARRSDHAGLGDWVVDKSVYPDGLHPLVEHVRSKGLQFGLWFEPEMVNPDSDLYRKHPEWVLHQESYETPLARNQLVLNIDKTEVFDYLFEKMSVLINEYRIDYIKWDHNRDLIIAGDGQQSRMHKQTLACYRLMDKLTNECDWLEIESCSSGGARADWGVLKYSGRVWTSDSIDAIDRVKIQRGYSYFTPPEVMGAHVGHAEAHLTGREINIHTRAIVALQGQYGYEIDARVLDNREKEILKHYVSLYKKHRLWISSARTWRLDSPIENLVCTGLVSDNQRSSLWFAVATASLSTTTAGKIVLKGLRTDTKYSVSIASDNKEELKIYTKSMPAWMHDDIEIDGALLVSVGLSLPVMPAQSGLLIEVTACE